MKFRTTLLLFITIFYTYQLDAQAPNYTWARSIGATSNDQGKGIVTDQLGNVYITGEFRNTVDFDPGTSVFNLTSNGAQDIFIEKLDSSGNLIWAKNIGGTGGDQGNSITIDTAGNIFITGQFQHTVDFDPGVGISNLASTGSTDIFVLKLDSSGNFIWAKGFGGTGTDVGLSIATDLIGNIYTTGYFAGSADFKPGPGSTFLTSNGGYDVFVQKLNPNGNFIWAKGMGGSTFDYGRSISVDSSGNVYLMGDFRGTADFFSGSGAVYLTSRGSSDVFIQKFNTSGIFVWVKQMGGVGTDVGQAITTDSFGNIYSTGYFEGTANFDPGVGTANLTSNGSSDVFVHKLNPLGDFIWAKSMGGTGTEGSNDIAIDHSMNIYLIGWFEGSADFDPGVGTTSLISNGSEDIFLQKLDSLGNFLWATHMGGPDSDVGYGLTVDDLNSIYTIGNFKSTVDFDPGAGVSNLTSNGNIDCFAQKLDQCITSTKVDSLSTCGPYTWIDGNTYSSSNNTATYTLTNSAGCDSVVTLNLTINNSSSGTDTLSTCGPYTWIDGNTYSSSNNTATYTLTNSAGCDSVVTLNLIINNVDATTYINGITIWANNTNALYQWIDCDNFYAPIPGEVYRSFTPISNGNYAVELIEYNCIKFSDCVPITTIGISERNTIQNFRIYPNPSFDYLTITGSLGTYSINVIDLTGRVIITTDMTTDSLQLDVSSLTQGVYLLKVLDKENGCTEILKFLKE